MLTQNYNLEGSVTFYIWVHDSYPADIPYLTGITFTTTCGDISSEYTDPQSSIFDRI